MRHSKQRFEAPRESHTFVVMYLMKNLNDLLKERMNFSTFKVERESSFNFYPLSNEGRANSTFNLTQYFCMKIN